MSDHQETPMNEDIPDRHMSLFREYFKTIAFKDFSKVTVERIEPRGPIFVVTTQYTDRKYSNTRLVTLNDKKNADSGVDVVSLIKKIDEYEWSFLQEAYWKGELRVTAKLLDLADTQYVFYRLSVDPNNSEPLHAVSTIQNERYPHFFTVFFAIDEQNNSGIDEVDKKVITLIL